MGPRLDDIYREWKKPYRERPTMSRSATAAWIAFAASLTAVVIILALLVAGDDACAAPPPPAPKPPAPAPAKPAPAPRPAQPTRPPAPPATVPPKNNRPLPATAPRPIVRDVDGWRHYPGYPGWYPPDEYPPGLADRHHCERD